MRSHRGRVPTPRRMPRTWRPAADEGRRHEETRTQPPHSSASTHLQPRHGLAAVKIVAAAPPGSTRPGASARPGRSRRPRTRGGEKPPPPATASHRGGLCPGGSGWRRRERGGGRGLAARGGGDAGARFCAAFRAGCILAQKAAREKPIDVEHDAPRNSASKQSKLHRTLSKISLCPCEAK